MDGLVGNIIYWLILLVPSGLVLLLASSVESKIKRVLIFLGLITVSFFISGYFDNEVIRSIATIVGSMSLVYLLFVEKNMKI